MVIRISWLAVLAITLVAGRSEVAFGQKPFPPSLRVQNAGAKEPVPPDYALKVFSDSRLPEPQAKFHRQVRDRLNNARIGVPDDRARYFRALNPPIMVPVVGWHATIDSIAPIENGIVVELSINAHLDGRADTATLKERYSIINGDVHYIGAYDPRYLRFSVSF